LISPAQTIDLDGLSQADFSFAPDAARGAAIDQRVRRHLAASLGKVFAAAIGVLAFDPQDAERLLKRIARGPVRAAVMALYTDLVGAVFADELDLAQALIDQLLTLEPDVPDSRLFTLDDAVLGAGQAERFLRIISDDGAAKLAFYPFAPDALAALAPVLEAALALLAAAAPALAGEIDILAREIILLDMRRPPSAETLLGGSSIFYLWGATFIVFNQTPTRLELAEALAHEAAHLLLFGCSLGKPLVSNDAQVRYASPLRDDPRPMDGLVHAAFVLARLTWLMQRLQDSGVLSAAEARTAAGWEARNRRDFAGCIGVIDAAATFTPAGAAAFTPAARFMAEIPVACAI
jgi:hypothetical protein